MTTINNLSKNDDNEIFKIFEKIERMNKEIISLSKLDIFSIFKEKKQYQIYSLDRPLDLVLKKGDN